MTGGSRQSVQCTLQMLHIFLRNWEHHYSIYVHIERVLYSVKEKPYNHYDTQKAQWQTSYLKRTESAIRSIHSNISGKFQHSAKKWQQYCDPRPWLCVNRGQILQEPHGRHWMYILVLLVCWLVGAVPCSSGLWLYPHFTADRVDVGSFHFFQLLSDTVCLSEDHSLWPFLYFYGKRSVSVLCSMTRSHSEPGGFGQPYDCNWKRHLFKNL